MKRRYLQHWNKMLYSNIYEYLLQYIDLKTLSFYVRANKQISIICGQKSELLKQQYLIPVEERKDYLIVRYKKFPNGWKHGMFQEFFHSEIFHEEPAIRKQCFYNKNKLEGLFEAWDGDKNPIEWCFYINNEKHGLFQTWHAGYGRLKERYNFEHGKQVGLQRAWCHSGQLTEKYTCIDGKINGLYEAWHADNANMLWRQCNYIDGTRVGLFQEWDNYGDLVDRREYQNGAIEGLHQTWHPHTRGKLKDQINYVNGKRQGLYQKWDYEGYLEETCMFVDDKIVGIHKTQKKYTYTEPTKTETRYVNGMKNGICRWWDKDKRLIVQCVFSNNMLNGLYEAWKYSDSQQPIEKENFMCENGKINGLYSRWFYNGYNMRLAIQGTFVAGEKCGIYKEWNNKGRLVFMNYFNHDKISRLGTQWDEKCNVYDLDYYHSRPVGPRLTQNQNGESVITGTMYNI